MTKLTKQQLALRTKWTTALRSGRYRQTQNRLRSGDEFCCLGVLCDVSGAGTWVNETCFHVGPEWCMNFPPHPVMAAASLGVEYCDLSDMNDKQHDDFATIADAIDLDTLMRQDGCL